MKHQIMFHCDDAPDEIQELLINSDDNITDIPVPPVGAVVNYRINYSKCIVGTVDSIQYDIKLHKDRCRDPICYIHIYLNYISFIEK